MTSIDPYHGYGLGLRPPHYAEFLEGAVPVDFVEVISENYMAEGGKPLRILDEVRAKHPVILHGVSMSVGSAGGLDDNYLGRLKTLAERIEPLWVSDHMCWTRTSAHNSHDLLPLPLTHEALGAVCDNIDHAQDTLGREMLFENPSTYLTFPEDEMSEWDFMAAIARRTGCYLLLDVNNVYVSAQNHEFDAQEYIAGLPLERVRQIHLAGHTPATPRSDILIDTHDREICDAVWDLYEWTLARTGPIATMIERDDCIPPLSELLEELERARSFAGRALRAKAA